MNRDIRSRSNPKLKNKSSVSRIGTHILDLMETDINK